MTRKTWLKYSLILAVISLLTLVAVGCQKKAADINSFADQVTNSQGSTNSNSSQRKAEMKKVLDPLVKANTINQSQEDKILEKLTTGFGNGFRNNGSRPSGSMPNGGGRGNENMPSGGEPGNGNMPNNGSMPSGSRPSWNMPSGNGSGRFNMLSSLVSDGTLTQKQADAVMKAIESTFSNNRQPAKSGSSASQK